ncbi:MULTISPECIES: branched-chain amino acid ABC transporter permease [Paraburkholderia]|uniref:branched-chain amino acid ABC transporter permease n=1 Tax=Paraburkholderia TaxID=1822464 RepID=UPI0022586D9F|nr:MULTISPECIES: branched-chain amino acid ABC transporter permease [Paraburkholderia]MCX4174534.1 branched-chain amino acid ABC transporter permease [Paraburkholderia madseniana]MDQ6462535.1 branched-chain amino acid ABC transporter permease [Paraburkholderia madseniana]
MFNQVLSGDFPRSRLLSVLLVVIFLYLGTAPFLFSGVRPINVAATTCVFIVLVASFDLLLGYCGVVSFAHAMFYGIGAYGTAIAISRMGPTWSAIALGTLGAVAVSVVVALLIALISLRVKAIFYSMMTLAISAAFGALVTRMSDITGGDDGLNFRLPESLTPSFRFFDHDILATTINGKVAVYYIIFFSTMILVFAMLRIVNSRFGRVMEAIRENEFRAEAIGYHALTYRVTVNCVAAAIATCGGVLMALWLQYVGPQSIVGFDVVLNILLMAVIGGLGTIYGPIVGVALFVIAENYLQSLMTSLAPSLASHVLMARLFDPDRWLLWFGIAFVLSVYFFPSGIVGKLRASKRGLL